MTKLTILCPECFTLGAVTSSRDIRIQNKGFEVVASKFLKWNHPT